MNKKFLSAVLFGPVEGITVNDEIVESYGNSNAVASLVVNENVYSPFNGDFNFSLVDAQDVNIPFGKYQINEQGDTYLTSYVDAKPGESVTIVPEKKMGRSTIRFIHHNG